MSLKITTSEYMLSSVNGLGMRRCWTPRVVAEAFLESTKDGDIKRAPDPVTMIKGDMAWYNNSDSVQMVAVMVHRAPRSVVSTAPVTVTIQDGWSYATGVAPEADYPSLEQDQCGGKLILDQPEVLPADMLFGRFFLDVDETQTWVEIGSVYPGNSLHFRYLCAVQTPGEWKKPTEFDVRYEAYSRWARLVALAWPHPGYLTADPAIPVPVMRPR